MGAIAKGKVNASELQVGTRIIIKIWDASREEDQAVLAWLGTDHGIGPSRTKTGEGVVIVTVTNKAKVINRRGYLITTSAGEFYAEPIQTMWLAPEDPAGIKRAHAEALELDKVYEAYPVADFQDVAEADENRWTLGSIEDAHAEALAEDADAEREIECPRCGGPLASDGVCADDECGADEEIDLENLPDPDGSNLLPIPPEFFKDEEIEDQAAEVEAYNLVQAEKARAENEAPGGMYYGSEWASSPVFNLDLSGGLTLHSQDGKVDTNSKDEGEENEMTSTDTQNREKTGSAVVRLMERVHERIRQNHPEVPEVVIVTGAGTDSATPKWGHFRARGWLAQDGEGKSAHVHEMFMAGETLAKGAHQVLQTMLHESAHALAESRGKKDTSRQGRWHNKVFLDTAKELGLEYRGDKANPQIGFSQVTLTDEAKDEYRDLLEDLDREINLMVKLPLWLGGSGDGGEDEGGGENMGRKPRGEGGSSSSIKLTCECSDPNIIRASKKVAEMLVVRCDDCEKLFRNRS